MEQTNLACVGVRYLDAATTRIYRGKLGALCCRVGEGEEYTNVYSVPCMPVGHPGRFIALWYTDKEDKEQELGVIEDLAVLPEEMRALVKGSLSQHFFERRIKRIYEVRWQYSLLFFEVEADEGRAEFMMRWQHDKAVDYGDKGKILLDVFENRFVIPSVEELPAADRDRMRRFIYW
ncbi:MAG: DUF1854 domain-containing protein [Planctomycetota bacterium]